MARGPQLKAEGALVTYLDYLIIGATIWRQLGCFILDLFNINSRLIMSLIIWQLRRSSWGGCTPSPGSPYPTTKLLHHAINSFSSLSVPCGAFISIVLILPTCSSVISAANSSRPEAEDSFSNWSHAGQSVQVSWRIQTGLTFFGYTWCGRVF